MVNSNSPQPTTNQIIQQRTSTQLAKRSAYKTGIDLQPEQPDTSLTAAQTSTMLPNNQLEEADIM